MENQISADIDLSNNENQHVYPYKTSSPTATVIISIVIVIVVGLLMLMLFGFLQEKIPDINIIFAFFLPVIIISGLLIFALIRSKKKARTHLIINGQGITILLANGDKKFFTYNQFINLKVTRNYYNGAYTGTTHELLFSVNGKEIHEPLIYLKDNVSDIYNDISQMKAIGHFTDYPCSGTDFQNSQPQSNLQSAPENPADDNRFPYGVSIIDGKFYTHPAEELKASVKRKSITLLIIALVLFICSLLSFLLSAGFGYKSGKVWLAIGIIQIITALTLGLIGAIRLLTGFSKFKGLVKQINFYSNCIIFDTLDEKKIFEIPNIRSIRLPHPSDTNITQTRYITVETLNHIEKINFGQYNSRKKQEIFASYNIFFQDMHVWSEQHHIKCINDVSI